MIPEVGDELSECVRPLGKRYDDVDEHAARVHTLAPHLHHGAERPEEHKLCEVLRAVAFKHQMINCSSVPLCASQPCDRENGNIFNNMGPIKVVEFILLVLYFFLCFCRKKLIYDSDRVHRKVPRIFLVIITGKLEKVFNWYLNIN